MLHKITLLLALLFTLSVQAGEENQVVSNGYTLHYNVLATDFLSPEVATQYNLTRSKNKAMITISVIKNIPDTTGEAVPAKIKVEAADLMQKPKEIVLREIREKNALYYIGDFPVIHREIVNFRIEARPEGESNPIRARFSHEFYAGDSD